MRYMIAASLQMSDEPILLLSAAFFNHSDTLGILSKISISEFLNAYSLYHNIALSSYFLTTK